MEHPTLNEENLIYQAEIQFTGVVDYGVTMEALTTGEMPIPPGGARFDQTFEGTLHGPVLRGMISGTDYLTVRADGQFLLHLHARVTTDDGTNISMSSEGISMQIEGERLAQLRSAVTLYTVSERYTWLNGQRLWTMGTLDPLTGRAQVRAYAT